MTNSINGVITQLKDTVGMQSDTAATSSSSGTTNNLVPSILKVAAKTFEERNVLYSRSGVDNYKDPYGQIMEALELLMELQPNIMTACDWSRLGLISHIVTKLTRYAAAFSEGGHGDSAHDLCVYSAMLEEMTRHDI
jgi:hypothetical protein